jgi:hypothetical protein
MREIVDPSLDHPLDFRVQDSLTTLDLTPELSPALTTLNPLCRKLLTSTGIMELFIIKITTLMTHMLDVDHVSSTITSLTRMIHSTTITEANTKLEETTDRMLTIGVTEIITTQDTNLSHFITRM